MLDQSLYQQAIKFAGQKHEHQTVPGTNANYLLHLSNVAMEVIVAYMQQPSFNINLAVQKALLHDTIEDTNTTHTEIKNYFSEQIANGVMALTKDSTIQSKKDRMQASIKQIKLSFKEVAIVKLADRITNLQSPPHTWDKLKIANYKEEAAYIASQLKGVNTYLDKRLALKIANYSIIK